MGEIFFLQLKLIELEYHHCHFVGKEIGFLCVSDCQVHC